MRHLSVISPLSLRYLFVITPMLLLYYSYIGPIQNGRKSGRDKAMRRDDFVQEVWEDFRFGIIFAEG